ncbi:hypothetical protein ACH4NF_01800 [Streptomyces sp. NPDC017248]|uniref:hypothetical protein n=1 Tax=unclassified Streptomyces TaxID=2593676 RepID=UPI0037BDFDD5
MNAEQMRAAHEAAVAGLARGALGALQGTGSTAVVTDHLQAAQAGPPSHLADTAGEVHALEVAAGAVRVLGADVLAGHVLAGHALAPRESAVIGQILAALPPAPEPPPAPPSGAEQPWLSAWIDWGLVAVWARLDPPAATSLAPPLPPPPQRCDPAAPRRRAAGSGNGLAGEGWVPWSLRMGRLASLALPGLDSPLHAAARTAGVPLARGAARAVLRRDYVTAARLTRWLAWLAAEGGVSPVDPALLVGDIRLRGPSDGRCTLDAAVATYLLERGRT